MARSTHPPTHSCPDDGTCHHACTGGCFRVHYCAPLSGAFSGGDWPREVVAAQDPYTYDETAADASEHAVTAAIVEG